MHAVTRPPTIPLKSPEDREAMHRAGRAAAQVLTMLEPHVRPGVTTAELDRLAREYVLGPLGCRSATIGYTAGNTRPPFPGAICTSVNHVVCHGIPGAQRLADGDIVNVDVTMVRDGWHGDTSRMFLVGSPGVLARRLVRVTHEAMCLGIAQVRPGARLGDAGHAIQRHAEAACYSVVREYCGHGIGRGFHENPQVLHYGRPGTGLELEPGMCFTVEPMLNAGGAATRELADGWTVITRDRSLFAQWEPHGAGHGDRRRGADAAGRRALKALAARITRRRGPRARRAPRARPARTSARARAARCAPPRTPRRCG